MGTCIWQGDLFYSAGLLRSRVLVIVNKGEIRRGFGKNAGEWTGRVEISKEEIPGNKRSINILLINGDNKEELVLLCHSIR